MSVEIVVIPSRPDDDQPRTILRFDGGEHPDWSLIQSDDVLRLEYGDAKPIEIATLSEFDKATHLTVAYDADQLRHQLSLFLDGESVRVVSVEGWLPAEGSRLLLGGSEAGSRWYGRIAGLAIYDRKLDPVEIERSFAGLNNK
jgi:hypothetical protein